MRRVLIDACVLVPPILREIVLGTAAGGAFLPLWSARILAEWQRVAAREGPVSAMRAEGEAARMAARWPAGCVALPHGGDSLDPGELPDPGDLHVLAAARAGSADTILTANLRDFPLRALAHHGLRAVSPDSFLMELWLVGDDTRAAVERAAEAAAAEAQRLSGHSSDLRRVLKGARLTQLARALAAG
jgi:hypothetical protein